MTWFSPAYWLLVAHGSFKFNGCSWLLVLSGSYGGSARRVVSSSMAALKCCFSRVFWLLCTAVSHLVLWLLFRLGSLYDDGCSGGMFLSWVLAAPFRWFTYQSWLLHKSGSLPCSGCSVSMVLSATMAIRRSFRKSGTLRSTVPSASQCRRRRRGRYLPVAWTSARTGLPSQWPCRIRRTFFAFCFVLFSCGHAKVVDV